MPEEIKCMTDEAIRKANQKNPIYISNTDLEGRIKLLEVYVENLQKRVLKLEEHR